MEIKVVLISELTPDPNNARNHPDENLNALEASLKEFGQRKPIVVDSDGVVIAGNATLMAAKKLGWTTIEVVDIPESWSAQKITAFALADNRVAELAQWDAQELLSQLESLDEFDMSLFGLEKPEIPILDIETYEDEAESPAEIPIAKLGDVWQLGAHRVVCGDSTDPAVLSLALDGELADCILTDPPYNVAYEGKTSEKLTIQNDEMSDKAFEDFLTASYKAMFEVTKEGGPIYVFHADTSGEAFRRNMVESGFMLKQCLIWVKNTLVLGRQDYNWQHEPILYGWKPGAAHPWHGPFTNTTVIDDAPRDLAERSKKELLEYITSAFEGSSAIRENKPSRSDIHPTMKPISLVSRLLKNSMLSGERVLDSFGGSGSTLIAAEQLGLKASLVELDPKYVDAIIKRWENLTGQKAEQVNDGPVQL